MVAFTYSCTVASAPQANATFQWIADIERDGGTHHLNATSYYIDRQYVLPDGTRIVGAGSGSSASLTTIVAVPTKPTQHSGHYHGCGVNHINRIGFVLGSDNYIGKLHFVGLDRSRFPDSHPLCGGAPFETPGCASAYCENSTNASYLVGGGEGIKHTLVEDVSIAGGSVQNGFWMPQTVSVSHFRCILSRRW
jgi:hypothetical protein